MTLHERLAGARAQLEAAGIAPAEAAIDVDVYARTILGWDRARVITNHQAPVPPALEPRLTEWLERREHHEPTAYIVGVREFWGLDFRVTPAVLIPRPETELVVERTLALLRPDATSMADLGTGSGAIALAVASERPSLAITAVDVSGEALEIARRNAARLQLGNVRFERGSWFAPIAGRRFEVIAANPPYVARGDKYLAQDVGRFEPEIALIGGVTGLEAIEQIVAQASAHLRPGGWLILEHGWTQAVAVRERLVRSGFAHVRSHADLSGHERVTEGSVP